MRFLKKSAKVEKIVYNYIDEIADDLELNVPYYPEVYWTGRNLAFDALGLPINFKKEYEIMKNNRRSYFITSPKIIFICRDDLVDHVEEAAHFLHGVHSKFTYKKKSVKDCIALRILDEMLAYFSSKLIIPDRYNSYGRYKEYLRMENIERMDFYRDIRNCLNDYFDILDFNIYQQGYGLGEALYYKFCTGKISLRTVKNLFLQNFDGYNAASNAFIELKSRLCN